MSIDANSVNALVALPAQPPGFATNDLVVGTPTPPRAKRRLIDKLNEVVSVADYGALGNGVADDAAALQAAIAAAAPGGVLFWPPGTYTVSSSVQFSTPDVKHFCEGGIATIRVRPNAPSGFAAATITASRQRFVNLAFDGSASTPPATNPNSQLCVLLAPTASQISDVVFDGCSFSNSYRSGIRYYGAAGLVNISLLNCMFVDMVNPSWGPVFNSSPCIALGNMTVVDNFVVSGCTFRNFTGAGLSLFPAAGTTTARQVVFANNTLDATGYETSFTSIGLECVGVAGVAVSGNSFRNMRMGLSLVEGRAYSVSANTFDNMGTYGVELGVITPGARTVGVAVAGNTFRACRNGVFLTSSADDVAVTGNAFTDLGVGAPANNGWALYAAVVSPNHTNVAFGGNSVANCAGARLSTVTGYTLTGNTLRGGPQGTSRLQVDATSVRGSISGNTYSTAIDLGASIAAIWFGNADVCVTGNSVTSSTGSPNNGIGICNTNGAAVTSARIANNLVENFSIGIQTNFGAATSGNADVDVADNSVLACTTPLLSGVNDSVRARRIITSNSPPTAGTYVVGDACLAQTPNQLGSLVGWQCTAAGTPGTWTPIGRINPWNVAFVGDADVTLTPLVSAGVIVYSQPLTANRTVTLSTTNVYVGCYYRVTRSAAATGASTVDVGGLKTLAVGQWCDVVFALGSFRLIAFGSL